MADAATEVPGDEGSGAYAWESELQRTWDAVEETADGELRSAAPGTWRGGGRAPVHVGVRRGVMRAVFLIIDCSRHAAEHDAEMKPSRSSAQRRRISPAATRQPPLP
jgi:transcription initiation factor TFIIH subunit 2